VETALAEASNPSGALVLRSCVRFTETPAEAAGLAFSTEFS
jgi:hypothetical protein